MVSKEWVYSTNSGLLQAKFSSCHSINDFKQKSNKQPLRSSSKVQSRLTIHQQQTRYQVTHYRLKTSTRYDTFAAYAYRAISVSGGIMPGRCLQNGDSKCPSIIRHSLWISSYINIQVQNNTVNFHYIFSIIISVLWNISYAYKTTIYVPLSIIFKDSSTKFCSSHLMHFMNRWSLTESIWTGWSAETRCWQVSRHDITFRNSNNLNFTKQTTQYSLMCISRFHF